MSKSPNVVVVLVIIILLLICYIMLHAFPQGSASEGTRTGSASHMHVMEVPRPEKQARATSRTKTAYSGKRRFTDATTKSPMVTETKNLSIGPVVCDRWAVVTTINAPTSAVQRQAHMRGLDLEGGGGRWCLLVVADAGGPVHYTLESPHNNFVYLSEQEQRAWATYDDKRRIAQTEFLRALPWGYLGRKNVGYLYAILHGAKYIWDFDDDVMVLSKHATIPVPGETAAGAGTGRASPDFETRAPSAPYLSEVFNPFPLFEANHNPSWPRGFPPDRAQSDSSSHDAPIETRTVRVPASSVAVVQYLANHDPDVDCLYRMIRPLPLDFPIHGPSPLILPAGGTAQTGPAPASAFAAIPAVSTSSSAPPGGTDQPAGTAGTAAVVASAAGPEVPSGKDVVFAPYNAQSTLHTTAALWALLLPTSLHPRVSDIWRSYVAQRLFADIGVRVAFHSPIAAHIRKSNNDSLTDLKSQLPLFTDTLDLLRALRAWKGRAATLPGRAEELYVHLYEEGYLGLQDVALLQLWLAALFEAGYAFPQLRQ
jgi:hypothetical protein